MCKFVCVCVCVSACLCVFKYICMFSMYRRFTFVLHECEGEEGFVFAVYMCVSAFACVCQIL